MTDPLSRRSFLSTALLTAGALQVSPKLFSQSKGSGSSDLHPVMTPVDFSQVKITDSFWYPKQQKVATATLSACIYQTEQKTGRIRNFEKAARRQGEAHEGIYYDDSDVYKALEAIAYSLRNRPDSQLEAKADEWIDKIAAAQLDDGYLDTYVTLKGLDRRWTDMEKHEDYCAGHLIEAAIAYYRTTGKRKLLDVAIRLADHIDQTFRLSNRHWVSGHEEIELALMKLFHLTRNDRYLKLADWYLEQRGHGYGRGALWGEGKNLDYCQDRLPVKQQRDIVGHAVRAMYLYSAVADVAAVTGDAAYLETMNAVWQDVVFRNLYITGGIGSSGDNEGFTRDYDLPNAQAYCETCASVGMVFWNHRMAQLTGDGKFIDILERSLYNGALSGLSLSGDRFFYGNPLASSTTWDQKGRSEWFGTACCPANIARLVASLGGYVYGVSDRDIWVNLFVASKADVKVGESRFTVALETDYPRDGKIKVHLHPEKPSQCALRLRIPGWAKGIAIPGSLYRFSSPQPEPVLIEVNGRSAQYKEDRGYAVVDGTWRPGDIVELHLPMPIHRIEANTEVEADRSRVALQRGPLVYCVEGADNKSNVWNFIVPETNKLTAEQHDVLGERIVAITGEAKAFVAAGDGTNVVAQPTRFTAIPYYAWANRDNIEMQVWLPTKVAALKVNI